MPPHTLSETSFVAHDSNNERTIRNSSGRALPGYTMNAIIAKILLPLMVLTLAVPETLAKRAGGGRSSGRQSQAVTQRSLPPPVANTMPRSAPAQPAHPQQALPQQAGSPWGGMLGGALLGLGLGSMMSGDRPAEAGINQAEGDSGTSGSGASGSGQESVASSVQPAEQVPQNSLGSVLLLAIFATIVFFAARRMRRR